MTDACKLLEETVVSLQAAAVTGRVVERLTKYGLLNRSSLGTRTSGEQILTLTEIQTRSFCPQSTSLSCELAPMMSVMKILRNDQVQVGGSYSLDR